jgi:phenylacetate-CoA ligase
MPLEFYQDERYLAYRRAARARSQRWYGFERGDKVALLSGSEQDLPQWTGRQRVFGAIERQRWLSVFHMSEERLGAFARRLEAWRPDFVVGYASGLHTLGQYVLRHGLRVRPIAVQSMAEQLWDFQRDVVGRAFGCPVIDFYGARESAPIATQCLERDGLHVMADLRIVEVINEAGRPAEPGEVGRVVLTDLTNYAMPLIRYANDDLASWKADEPCPCGRTLPRLASIHGRSSDVIRLKDGSRIHGYFFMFLFYGVRGVDQFQVRQTSLDTLDILIKPNAEFRPGLLDELKERIDRHTGAVFRIECRLVDEIPITAAGKRRFTISDVAAP